MNATLFDDFPILVDRVMAKKLGLNESIVLQQVHYWIMLNKRQNKNLYDGKYWTFNSIKVWHEETFYFWSFDTVKRTFKKLEDMGLLITGNFNKQKYDRTKWYTIDYNKLSSTLGQNAPRLIRADCTNGSDADCTNENMQIDPSNTKDYTKTTKDNISEDKSSNNVPYKEIIDYLNLKANKKYKYTKTTISKINARCNEGFTLEDFKQVIDIKCNQWINDSKMKVYLRPETLFGTKFESYLNEVSIEENIQIPNTSNMSFEGKSSNDILKELNIEI